MATIRRHRIVERFLSDMLGYKWNEADRLATTFEHDLPQEVEDRIYLALDRPETCPHGFPIPEPETADLPELPPLYDLEPGDVAVVAVPGVDRPGGRRRSSTGSGCGPAGGSRCGRSTRSTGPWCCRSTATTARSAGRWPPRSSSSG